MRKMIPSLTHNIYNRRQSLPRDAGHGKTSVRPSVTLRYRGHIRRVPKKNQAPQTLAVTLSNLNRFQIFSITDSAGNLLLCSVL